MGNQVRGIPSHFILMILRARSFPALGLLPTRGLTRSRGAREHPFLNSSRGPQAESERQELRAHPSRPSFPQTVILAGPGRAGVAAGRARRARTPQARRGAARRAGRCCRGGRERGGAGDSWPRGKGRREAGYYGMWGSRGRRAPYPPVTVQSLNSPVVRVFVQSHSHSPGRRFPSGSENHARSQLRHPRSARNPALSVTRKYRPHDTPFRFRVPIASKTLK